MQKNTDSNPFADLFRDVDAHLRDAERLRNFVEQQPHLPFYPERRRQTRVPVRGDDPPKDTDVP